ncbi:MAG: hypothetical protein ACYTFG_15485 [Planctomycetota bacterium]
MKTWGVLAALLTVLLCAVPGQTAEKEVDDLLSALEGEDETKAANAVKGLREAGVSAVKSLYAASRNPEFGARERALEVLCSMPIPVAAWRLKQERRSLAKPKKKTPTLIPSPKPIGWVEPRVDDPALGEVWLVGPGSPRSPDFLWFQGSRRGGGGWVCRCFSVEVVGQDRCWREETIELDEELRLVSLTAQFARDVAPREGGEAAALATLTVHREGEAAVWTVRLGSDPAAPAREGTIEGDGCLLARSVWRLVVCGLDFALTSKYTVDLLTWDGKGAPEVRRLAVARSEDGEDGAINLTGSGEKPLLAASVGPHGGLKRVKVGGTEFSQPTVKGLETALLTEVRLWQLWVSGREARRELGRGPSKEAQNAVIDLGWPVLPRLTERLKACADAKRGDWIEVLEPLFAEILRLAEGKNRNEDPGVDEALAWWKKTRGRFFPTSIGKACWRVVSRDICDFKCLLPPGYEIKKTGEATDFRVYTVAGRGEGARLELIIGIRQYWKRPFFPDRKAERTGPGGFRTGCTPEGLYWGEGMGNGIMFRFETRNPFERLIFLGIVANLWD